MRRKIEDTAAETRRHLVELVKSPSFLAAMAHVCSLTQKMDWATGSAPGEVTQWDRKAWSHENHFTAVGVSVDPGNHVLSIIMLAIRHILGMEPPSKHARVPQASGKRHRGDRWDGQTRMKTSVRSTPSSQARQQLASHARKDA